jgi:hypothetical protein
MRSVTLPICCGIAIASLAARAADVAVSAPPQPPPASAAAGAAAGHPDAASEARIPFANSGGIYNWRAMNDKTLLIQGQDRKWYKATLLSSCVDLPFAERLGFESNPDGSFDKFSAIQVGNQRCQVVSFVETAAPGKKSKAKKPDKAAAAATSATTSAAAPADAAAAARPP